MDSSISKQATYFQKRVKSKQNFPFTFLTKTFNLYDNKTNVIQPTYKIHHTTTRTNFRPILPPINTQTHRSDKTHFHRKRDQSRVYFPQTIRGYTALFRYLRIVPISGLGGFSFINPLRTGGVLAPRHFRCATFAIYIAKHPL